MADSNSKPFATISTGDTTVIAAPSDPRGIAFIRILGYEITAADTTVITLVSGVGTFPRRICDTLQCPSGGGAVAPQFIGGTFDLDPGAAFIINNLNAVSISGRIRYTVMGAG